MAIEHYRDFMFEIAAHMRAKKVYTLWKDHNDRISEKIKKLESK